jgi:DNA invertase Pin-like site-specific DNA recombinase
MALVGYARVSSIGQSLDVQEAALADAGCDKVFAEKKSGTTTGGREELQRALEYVRAGDTLIVTRIDRLARSATDLNDIVRALSDKGVEFKALQQGQVDTTTASGKMMLGLLGLFAEFETDLRRERQMEGIAKAKAEGRYRGRPTTVPVDEVRRLAKEEGLNPHQIQKRLGIGRGSVYRALKHAEEPVAS